MLELADWAGLAYYMLKEENSKSHIVLVKDKNQKKALFNLETGSIISNELPLSESNEATRMLNEFRYEFLEYWNKQKSLMR